MEISLLKKGSIKIKSKNALLTVDPVEKNEADIYFNMAPSPLAPNTYDPSLLIQGPGEYEVKGVSVHGKGIEKEVIYTILADSMKVMLLSSNAVNQVKDADEVAAIIIKVESEIKDSILSLSSTSLLIFYGDTDLVKLSDDKVTKSTKVNLKKREELAGSAIILSSD